MLPDKPTIKPPPPATWPFPVKGATTQESPIRPAAPKDAAMNAAGAKPGQEKAEGQADAKRPGDSPPSTNVEYENGSRGSKSGKNIEQDRAIGQPDPAAPGRKRSPSGS